MEMLDIVDENGVPTGETVDREAAHRNGIRHRTSHVWILRKRNGKTQVLLQKRSLNKDSHPGCYDTSSAGHIPSGEDFLESSLRELQEELGITAAAEELLYCGCRRSEYRGEFHGRYFWDHQVSNVYILWRNRSSPCRNPKWIPLCGWTGTSALTWSNIRARRTASESTSWKWFFPLFLFWRKAAFRPASRNEIPRSFKIPSYTKASRLELGRLAFVLFTVQQPRSALAKRFSFSSADTNPGHQFHRYSTGSVTDKKHFASSSGD